jgi:hypothetical protein
MSDGHSLMEKQQQLPVTNDGWNDAAKEAAERALRGASAIKDYRARVKRLRRLGGKDANAALRAQIGDKPPAGRP